MKQNFNRFRKMMKCFFILSFSSPKSIYISRLYLAIFAVPNNLSLVAIPTHILSSSRSIHAYSFSLDVPQPMQRALSHKATYTVSTYTLSQTHSPTQIHHNHIIFPWTPPHAHSWDVQIHLYRQAHSTRPQHLSSHYTDILLPSIQ